MSWSWSFSKCAGVIFSEGSKAKADLGKSFMISEPLATFMDEVSYCDTLRHYLLLRERGVNLEDHAHNSKLDHASVRAMNWDLMNGVKAGKAVEDYSTMLLAPPSCDIIKPFNLQYPDYFSEVFITMADTFYRLCLPSKRLQVQIFGIVFMTVEQAAAYLTYIQQTYQKCCSGDSLTQVLLARLTESFGSWVMSRIWAYFSVSDFL